MFFWKRSNPNKRKYHPVDSAIIKEFNAIRAKEKRKYLCHAPFKSMTFFHTGAVLACWYNKLFPLGNYPDDTVQGIWFSNRAEKLRNYIKNHDLSYGCADCRKNFSNRNFYAAGPWRYDFLPEKSGKYPVSIDFQISNKCNLQCIMCNGEYSANVRQNRENQDQYENPYDEAFFRQIEPFIPHLMEASFSGGEPFFAPEFFKIWDMIREINPKIRLSVTTNGNILTERVKQYLDDLTFNISVSLDAISEESYNRIRVNGKLSNVLENMEYFKEYAKVKGTTFAVKICPMRQNWEELPDLVTYLNDRNISFLFNTVFYPAYCSLWNLPSIKLSEIHSYLDKYKFAESTEIQKQNTTRYNDLVRQTEIWKNEAGKREERGFDNLDSKQLAKIVLANVQKYITEELSQFGDDCPVKLDEVVQLIDMLINDSPDEKSAVAGMKFYASAPVERWLSEIVIRDYKKNRDRFLQIGIEKD